MKDGVYEPGDTYNPVSVGSIDGTDVKPHDHAIVRAIHAHCTFKIYHFIFPLLINFSF